MSITSITFKEPVAKVADSPWNTIINGLNYTKTNLSPVPLKSAEAYHATNGMILAQSAYQALPVVTTNPSGRSYTWNGGVRDSKDPNKFWINVPVCSNSWNYSTNSSAILMKKRMDDSGRTYTECIPITLTYSGYGCYEVIYQNDDFLYVLYNSFVGTGSNFTVLIKYRKRDGGLAIEKTSSIESGNYSADFYFLGEKNGKLYVAIGTTTSSSYSEGDFRIYSYNLSSDTYKREYTKTLNVNSMINIMCSDVQNNELYFADLCAGPTGANGYPIPKIYKLTFSNDWSTITETEMEFSDILKENGYYTGLDNLLGNTQLKVFMHSYTIGDEKYLVKINVRNNTVQDSLQTYYGDPIKFYKIEGNVLTEVNSLGDTIYNIIPKNNWNTIFAACNSGVRVYSLDRNTKKIIEQPSIDVNLYQFGFDLDERLWVLSRDGSVYRYNYNQPATISYAFEKERYALQDSSPVNSYVNVSVMNYMGEPLNMTVTLQAIGNFSFQGDQKEIQVALNSETATQIPVVITGAGTYQLILK